MYCELKAYSLIHPLAFNAEEMFACIMRGETALELTHKPYIETQTFTASFSDKQNQIIDSICPYQDWTRFEKLLLISANDALQNCNIDASSNDVIFVMATTKGSIEEIDAYNDDQLNIAHSAKKITTHFKNPNTPIIISSACISGLSAIITACNTLKTKQYRYAVVIGADTINDFVLSGFNSLLALSESPCQPFDLKRNGINLGEGSAAIIFEAVEHKTEGQLYYSAGCITNDANHISGPSKTGEELAYAIKRTLKLADCSEPDFISMHGTATSFNDEMESKAYTLAGMKGVPMHSLKPYFGHTLGAAGVIESIVCLQMLANNILIPSLGFQIQGTSEELNIQRNVENRNINSCIKTMSGFGGANAAVLFEKN